MCWTHWQYRGDSLAKASPTVTVTSGRSGRRPEGQQGRRSQDGQRNTGHWHGDVARATACASSGHIGNFVAVIKKGVFVQHAEGGEQKTQYFDFDTSIWFPGTRNKMYLCLTSFGNMSQVQGQAGCTLPPKALPEAAVALKAGEGSA